MSRRLSAVLVSLCLAVAIHADWHFARATHHRLSLGLSWHWILAVPVFALTAHYVVRAWTTHVLRASIIILGSAIVAAGVLEPAWEYFVGDAPFDWAFGPERNRALATFVVTGLAAYAITMISERYMERFSDPQKRKVHSRPSNTRRS